MDESSYELLGSGLALLVLFVYMFARASKKCKECGKWTARAKNKSGYTMPFYGYKTRNHLRVCQNSDCGHVEEVTSEPVVS